MQHGSVTVVGGGLVGLFSALWLAQDGWDVTLVEGESLGSGAAQGNGGWICPSLSKPLAGPGMISHTIAQTFARDAAMKLHLPPRRATAGWIARFVRLCTPGHLQRTWTTAARLSDLSVQHWDRLADRGVDVAINRDGIVSLHTDPAAARTALEGAGPVHELGQPAPRDLLTGDELRELEPLISSGVAAGFVWPDQGYVDPRALVAALASALLAAGVEVVENSPVLDIREDDRQVTCRTTRGEITSDRAVVATGAGISRLLRPLGLKVPVIAGKGYSFDVASDRPLQHALSMPGPHVVATPLGDRVRIAGIMELDRDETRLNAKVIRRIVRGASPYLDGVDWQDRRNEWVGARPITPDTLPVIGPVRPDSRVLVAGGHGTMGVTQGPGTAELVRGMLAGETGQPSWVADLDPGRFGRRA